MSVTAITARFATLVWTAATIRFITQTPRMMKNNGNALRLVSSEHFLFSLKISCVKFASKGDFDSIEIRKSLVLQDFSGFCNYSHSSQMIVLKVFFCDELYLIVRFAPIFEKITGNNYRVRENLSSFRRQAKRTFSFFFVLM